MSGAATMADPAPGGFRESLRRFGPAGIVAFLLIFAGALVFMPIAAVLILIWAWASKSWRAIGFAKPDSWIGGLVVGIVLGVGLKFLMKAVVLPWLGAPPTNPLFHYLAGNTSEAVKFAIYAVLGAGFAEELFFRGYLMERLGRLIGDGAAATAVVVVIVTALFGAAHWQQGLFGMINAAVTGSIAAVVYLICGRKLWVPVVMHSAFDLTAAAMIYLNLETETAHLVFK